MSDQFSLIKQLRDKTGISIIKCKEAIEHCNGDIEEAIVYLRKQGSLSAAKKADRSTGEGFIAYKKSDKFIGLVELNCETDFVAKTQAFLDFGYDVANIASKDCHCMDNIFQSSFDDGTSVEEQRAQLVQKTGENIQIRRCKSIKVDPNNSYGIYSHIGSRDVAIVAISKPGFEDLARDIAVNVVAFSPSYISPQNVPSELIEKEREIAAAQIKDKPQHVVDKILEGRLSDFFSKVCINKMQSVQDPKSNIESMLKQNGDIQIDSFVCWRLLEE